MILVVVSGIVMVVFFVCFLFFQAEDGIRGLVRSRGLGDVYKRQVVGRDNGLGQHAVERICGGHPFRARGGPEVPEKTRPGRRRREHREEFSHGREHQANAPVQLSLIHI